MTKEHDLQNEIRLHVSREQLGTLFRANVGQGWAGKVQRMHLTPDTNTILLVNPRPFSTGLPVGFPDLFGFVPVTITPDMVGQEIAVFAAVEVKQKTGRVSAKQRDMMAFLQKHGARAGVARSVDDAARILSGEGVADALSK
ncbi:VRR-NUC domain-containing protein [Megasphaera stantonii]|uniref:VRR-NUC domain-containing protein n=1 Tax=Megasphaera stantonii TaxID=2144175 RepID=UPI001DEC4A5E|nr:VRR-NUC domain-containing protein [Megasphaera stantonii]HJE82654.1 VRR-NUC domain-containing protein [Megasphaera stantonii]